MFLHSPLGSIENLLCALWSDANPSAMAGHWAEPNLRIHMELSQSGMRQGQTCITTKQPDATYNTWAEFLYEVLFWVQAWGEKLMFIPIIKPEAHITLAHSHTPTWF